MPTANHYRCSPNRATLSPPAPPTRPRNQTPSPAFRLGWDYDRDPDPVAPQPWHLQSGIESDSMRLHNFTLTPFRVGTAAPGCPAKRSSAASVYRVPHPSRVLCEKWEFLFSPQHLRAIAFFADSERMQYRNSRAGCDIKNCGARRGTHELSAAGRTEPSLPVGRRRIPPRARP